MASELTKMDVCIGFRRIFRTPIFLSGMLQQESCCYTFTNLISEEKGEKEGKKKTVVKLTNRFCKNNRFWRKRKTKRWPPSISSNPLTGLLPFLIFPSLFRTAAEVERARLKLPLELPLFDVITYWLVTSCRKSFVFKQTPIQAVWRITQLIV